MHIPCPLSQCLRSHGMFSQPAETCQHNHKLVPLIQSPTHWKGLGGSWRWREDGPSILSFYSSQHHWHYFSPCAHSFHETDGGGGVEEKGRGEVAGAGAQRGSWVGCGVLGNCRSHAESGCLHVHQHVSALLDWGGEYWISLWSGLNLWLRRWEFIIDLGLGVLVLARGLAEC